jgi:uncharacterized protein YbbK (DUF523 family)
LAGRLAPALRAQFLSWLNEYGGRVFGASACLVGLNTRYDGKSALDPFVYGLFCEGKVVPFCPEQLGGLGTPRARAEISLGSGEDVLDGKALVLLEDGTDATEHFVRGAREVVRAACEMGITRFYLKGKSSSCGLGSIYVGGELVKGNGVLVAALLREGIEPILA